MTPDTGRLGGEPGRSGTMTVALHLAWRQARGGRLTIGETSLTIRAVLGAEPDRAASLVRLGPRVFLSPAALERARLVSFGSRVRYRALLRLPDGLAAGDTRAELARAIVDPGVRVAAYDEAQPGLRRFFSQL